jgi:hypothetical protein
MAWKCLLENPEWWLASLGFVTLFVVIWQTIQTKKASLAAKDAAQAALTQAKHTVASERAWLAIKSSMSDYKPRSVGDDFLFWWTIKNGGSTPARILETNCKYELIEHEPTAALPKIPESASSSG